MLQTAVGKGEIKSRKQFTRLRATSAVADAIEGGVGVVRRAAKQGGDVAEEFLSVTTQRIPALTVAATFAVGFTTGALISWIIKGD
jgi:hypothetical protein